MEPSFLTPLAGCFALTAVLPLAAYRLRDRRAHAVRSALGLAEPSRAAHRAHGAALALVPALLGLAAAQPVLERERTRPQRTDAGAFVVLDTSRSMLASGAPRAATRIERARGAALAFQRALPEIPIGLATFSERMLPHAFPTTDARVLAGVLADSLGIERPRPLPVQSFAQHSTTLDALAAAPTANYFSPAVERRLLVVLTDGETRRVGPSLARAFRGRQRLRTIVVRFWDRGERVYPTGVAEPGYEPDAASTAKLSEAASLIGARVFEENELDDAIAAAADALGTGPTRPRTFESERLALMPYVALAAVLPLALVLWRRNV